jgi:hypothetical protein
MDNNDVLRAEDVASVRTEVLRARRRVLSVAAAAPILAALLVWIAVYFLKLQNVTVSTFVAAIFLLLGATVFVHWWQRYRSILVQLDLIAERVASGEAVYGSTVALHLYR